MDADYFQEPNSPTEAFGPLARWDPPPTLVNTLDLITRKVSQVLTKSTSKRDWDSLCRDFLINDTTTCHSKARADKGDLLEIVPVTNFDAKVQAFESLRAKYFDKWANEILIGGKSIFMYGSGSKKVLMDTFLKEHIVGKREIFTIRAYDNALNAKEALCALLRLADASLEDLTFRSPARRIHAAFESVLQRGRRILVAIHNLDAASVESLVRSLLLPLMKRHGSSLQLIGTFDDCRWLTQCDFWRLEENKKIKLYNDVHTHWDLREEVAATYLVRRGETHVSSRGGDLNSAIFEGLRVSDNSVLREELSDATTRTVDRSDSSSDEESKSVLLVSSESDTEAPLEERCKNYILGYKRMVSDHLDVLMAKEANLKIAKRRARVFMDMAARPFSADEFPERRLLSDAEVRKLFNNRDLCDQLANEFSHMVNEKEALQIEGREDWKLQPFLLWCKAIGQDKLRRWKESLDAALRARRNRKLAPSELEMLVNLMKNIDDHCPALKLQPQAIAEGNIRIIPEEDLLRLRDKLSLILASND